MKEIDVQIYNKQEYLDGMLDRLKGNYSKNFLKSHNNKPAHSVLPSNVKLIEKFSNHCINDNMSQVRVGKYIYHLTVIAEQIGKDLSKATKQDIESFMQWLMKSKYSENTRKDFKVALKKVFCWLESEKQGISVKELKLKRLEPNTVNWFTVEIKKNKEKLPESLLTEDDILALIANCSTSRDKAFISSLYESGARISELGCLKIKNIAFDSFGCAITISGKTGSRRCRLVSSSKYLATWLNQHPLKDNPEAPVWLGFQNKLAVEYCGLAKIIRQAGKKAKIKKPLNPHAFRHSRATALAKVLSEQQMKSYLGWTGSSLMAATYVHLSGKDSDDAILGLYGLKEKAQDTPSKLLPKKCLNCNETNEPQASFCTRCQKPLSLAIALQQENNLEVKNGLILKEMELRLSLMENLLKGKKN